MLHSLQLARVVLRANDHNVLARVLRADDGELARRPLFTKLLVRGGVLGGGGGGVHAFCRSALDDGGDGAFEQGT